MNLVNYRDGKATTTSKIVGDIFGKQHRDVLRAIKNMECSDKFRVRNFAQSEFLTSQNKKHSCFEITRDGFMFLAMGFTGKEAATWKESFIDAFNDMDTHIAGSETFMGKINSAIQMLEGDKEKASVCASGLSTWKRIKKQRESEVKKLINQAQLILKLEPEL